MTYPDHYLFSWGGHFVSDPTEIWTNNIRMARPEGLDSFGSWGDVTANRDSLLTNLKADLTAHFANTDSGYSTNVKCTWLKFNRIDGNGRYASPSNTVASYFSGAPLTGTAGPCVYPVTTSLVMTWLSSTERGPGSRGRVFVPCPGIALDSTTLRVTSTKRGQLVTAWRTFLVALNNFAGLDAPNYPVASIVSNVGNPGPAKAINQVQCGDILDYMGSRRNNLKEVRSVSAVI